MPLNVNTIIKGFYALLIVSFFAIGFLIFSAPKPGVATVYFFDVGQGDAIFIRTPDGHTILIDGGPDQRVLEKLGRALPFYEKTVDLVILTHPHADHLAGLLGVLKRYDIKRILVTNVLYDSSMYATWYKMVADEKSHVMIADHRGTIDVGGATLTILYPNKNFSGRRLSNVNDNSIVVRFEYNKFSVLLTGDQEREEDLVEDGLIIPATVLKVGHHGSSDASNQYFLFAVRPTVAVISVGAKNRYSHPDKEALTHLMNVGAKVLRTDLHGDITITSDGSRWWHRTSTNP